MTASLGERRVRTTFNPSNNALVDQLKQDSAALINCCNEARNNTPSEQARLWSLAMTAYEDAAMWAVKAATYEDKS